MNPEQLSLVDPTTDLADELADLAADFARAGEERYSQILDGAAAELATRVAELVEQLEYQARGHDLPPGNVPQTTYWLRRGSDGALLGTIRLRHQLTPWLEVEGGNIGYDVRPAERRKGYGTRQLALALEKARALGLPEVLVTCDDDNVGSARIIERNGGKFRDMAISPDSGKPVRHYWISLTSK